MSEYSVNISRVKALICDVDGVLTDGGMYYSENGDELKKFNVRDGMGVALLKEVGIPVAVVTGEDVKLVRRRIDKLKIEYLFAGVQDKLACIRHFCSDLNMSLNDVAYIGDELNDYGLIGNVGVFFSVSDANPIVRDAADIVLDVNGGQGALRAAAVMILREQDMLESAISSYLARSIS